VRMVFNGIRGKIRGTAFAVPLIVYDGCSYAAV